MHTNIENTSSITVNSKGVNYTILFDKADSELIKLRSWRITLFKGRNTQYAIHEYVDKRKRKALYMHSYILGKKAGKVIDHINGNGLDNRRSNLRFCSISQNLHNSKKQKNNSSGYKGITKTKNSHRCFLQVKNKKYYLGARTDMVYSAIVYDVCSIILNKEYALTNFTYSKDYLAFIKSIESDIVSIINNGKCRGKNNIVYLDCRKLGNTIIPRSEYSPISGLLSYKELARRLNVSRQRVSQLRDKYLTEKYDFLKIGGRFYYKIESIAQINNRRHKQQKNETG